mmetsp:Transcript_4523/g.13043  ORF Transcript_4523/g.13043 Transcript_4523/m.13043 type:complete len:304 (-) Transcript_4523:728-1639(-)
MFDAIELGLIVAGGDKRSSDNQGYGSRSLRSRVCVIIVIITSFRTEVTGLHGADATNFGHRRAAVAGFLTELGEQRSVNVSAVLGTHIDSVFVETTEPAALMINVVGQRDHVEQSNVGLGGEPAEIVGAAGRYSLVYVVSIVSLDGLEVVQKLLKERLAFLQNVGAGLVSLEDEDISRVDELTQFAGGHGGRLQILGDKVEVGRLEENALRVRADEHVSIGVVEKGVVAGAGHFGVGIIGGNRATNDSGLGRVGVFFHNQFLCARVARADSIGDLGRGVLAVEEEAEELDPLGAAEDGRLVAG